MRLLSQRWRFYVNWLLLIALNFYFWFDFAIAFPTALVVIEQKRMKNNCESVLFIKNGFIQTLDSIQGFFFSLLIPCLFSQADKSVVLMSRKSSLLQVIYINYEFSGKDNWNMRCVRARAILGNASIPFTWPLLLTSKTLIWMAVFLVEFPRLRFNEYWI